MQVANIIVKQGALRSKPSFIGQMITNLNYGEAVEISENSNGWSKAKVVKTGQIGWIHTSAISKQSTALKSGDLNSGKSHSATSDELALAGKGFNRQVEQQFKAQNPNVDFSWINKMETFRVSDSQIAKFLKEGQVMPLGGGA
ncbi:MAG: SH3 domain-containing protein [Desulfamplus sp.]|nr:SH3 domain-containing protein [Desulfamplus sp.]